MSAVWQYFFVECEKDIAAECIICNVHVLRGGTEQGKFNTTNLIKHLKQHHKIQHEGFCKATEVKKQSSGSFKQPTLFGTFGKRDKLPRNCKKALAITEKVAQFNVLDDQPPSVVSNVGFKWLIEHLEPHYIMPSHHYMVDKTICIKKFKSVLPPMWRKLML